MPIHDWTRVSAGVFHDFHIAWIVELARRMNSTVLPPSYYAIIERAAEVVSPDEPPADLCEATILAKRRNQLVIRRVADDGVIAVLEIPSPGNKGRNDAVDTFVAKSVGALDEGYHLMVIDVFPPGPSDPNGIHGAIWQRLRGTYRAPTDKPLTLASYVSAGAVTCFVEPTAVGMELIEMPLFLTTEMYVNVPLEPTCRGAYEGVPQRWKRVIEGGI